MWACAQPKSQRLEAELVSRESSELEYHQEQCRIAAEVYVRGLNPASGRMDWYSANLIARRQVINTLRETVYLTDLDAALVGGGRHLTVLRHLLAPPMSQDQFSLLCSGYSKSVEKTGRGLSPRLASEVSACVMEWRNRRLTPWIDTHRAPRRDELKSLIQSTAPLLSQQLVQTLRRNRLSAQQELEVIELLQCKGWTAKQGQLVSALDDLPARHFLHKTRFATKTLPQEVDIACGLGGTVVLAMECKVTNDATNSIKRINDVLKKATAWQDHWGSFVRTAALLQGVVGYKDVSRLLAANVHVFWSHDLDRFERWIDDRLMEPGANGSRRS